jgi:hypothetical protein
LDPANFAEVQQRRYGALLRFDSAMVNRGGGREFDHHR